MTGRLSTLVRVVRPSRSPVGEVAGELHSSGEPLNRFHREGHLAVTLVSAFFGAAASRTPGTIENTPGELQVWSPDPPAFCVACPCIPLFPFWS